MPRFSTERRTRPLRVRGAEQRSGMSFLSLTLSKILRWHTDCSCLAPRASDQVSSDSNETITPTRKRAPFMTVEEFIRLTKGVDGQVSGPGDQAGVKNVHELEKREKSEISPQEMACPVLLLNFRLGPLTSRTEVLTVCHWVLGGCRGRYS